jgi:NTE family protein
VLLGLSGGGTRAAALAYGVFEELAATRIQTSRGEQRLLDEVDVISSVSGGSFTNAYFGLFGDRLFDDFKDKMLLNPIEDQLYKGLFNPLNWRDLGNSFYGRNDMAAQYYDRALFQGKTFGDIDQENAPWIIINATDIGTGNRIVFTPNFFDLLCVDFDSYSVARAVAASSAVPGAATPISLKNYAGQCGDPVPSWLGNLQTDEHPFVSAIARNYQRLKDSRVRPWLHLVDGGVTDNLGLRQFYAFSLLEMDPLAIFDDSELGSVSDILVISVNAAVHHEWQWANNPELPSESTIIRAMIDIQMQRFTTDTLYIVREHYRKWGEQRTASGQRAHFNLVEVAISAVEDANQRAYLNAIPTSLQLEESQVDQLIEAGRSLLRDSVEYQQFLARHRGKKQDSGSGKFEK